MVENMHVYRRGAILLAAALLAACSGKDDEAAGGPGGKGGRRPMLTVSALTAPVADFAPTLVALGTVAPSQSVAVRPRADGEIVGIAFAEGQFVKAGQLLFRLDARQAQAAVQQAEAELKGAVAAERRARLDYERAEALVAKGFVSTAMRDQLRAAAFAAKSDIETRQAQLTAARVQLSFLSITAPISGRTGELGFRLGANVRQGEATPLVTINQLAPIHVRFLVPPANISQARAVLAQGGGRVLARDQATGALLGTGRLVFLDNNVDPGSGGVTARAEFANADDGLWPGAIVNVEFPLGKAVPHVAVPESAVQTGRDAPFVWTLAKAPDAGPGGSDGKPEGKPGAGPGAGPGGGMRVAMRDVSVAGRLDGTVYLAGGLKPGERIVVDALGRLKEGDTVRVKPAGNAPKTARGGSDAPAIGTAG